MIHILKEIDERSAEEINDYVDNHPSGTPFHLASWIQVLTSTYSFKPHCIVSRNIGGKIQGLLPFVRLGGIMGKGRLCSLPFSDSCGPLADTEEALTEIVEQLELFKGSSKKGVEIRSEVDKSIGYISKTYFRRHFIPLPHDMGELLRTLNKRTVQYSIRKAMKAGLVVQEESNEEGIVRFQRLNCLTRRKHGVPFQSKKFFEAVYDKMISKGRGHVLLGYYNGIPIAGALLIKSKGMVVYKYSASDPQFITLLAPNHLMTLRAIELSYESGAKIFDFGRTELSNLGLLRFKEMWATQQEELSYSYYPSPAGAFPIFDSSRLVDCARAIWRQLPMPIASRISGIIYRYLT